MKKALTIGLLAVMLESNTTVAQVTFAGEPVPAEDSRVLLTLDRFIKVYRRQQWMDSTMRLAIEVYPVLTKILAEEGIPEDFKYLPVVESLFDVFAVSPAGARGMWQFMPATATACGLKVGRRDERSNFVKSTRSACYFLKSLYKKFGSWQLAAAAYNCGEGNLSAAIKRSGTRDYFKISLCKETSEYIYRVVAVKHVFENDEQYGGYFRTRITEKGMQVKEKIAGRQQGFRSVYFDRDSLSTDGLGWHQP